MRGEEIDGRSDVFSLGIVVYELATGVRPFERSNVLLTAEAVLNANVAAPSTLNPDLPINLDRVIGKMLEKDRERRYGSVADVSSDLRLLSESPKRTWRKWKAVSIGASVALVCGVGTILFESHRTPVLTNKDTVVLADFANSTGDPMFDGTLRHGLAVQLEQSPFLNIIPEQRIHHMLRLMGRSPDTRLSPELSRQICERTGSAAALEGSIAKLGSQYVLGLRARSCRTGDVLDDELAQTARKEDILNVLSQIAARFRTRVGESLSSIQQHDTPLAEATTPSLEALEAYSAGLKVHFANGAAAALPLFRHAVEIDPEFAMAHAWLGRTYANLDESDLSMQSISRAWQLRNRVSDHEKFAIITRYDALVTGNLEATRQTCEAWTQTYPRDPQPHIGLSVYYRAAGQYETAAAESRKAIEVDPDLSIGYYELALSQVYLDRREEAENTLRRAGGRGLEIDEFIMLAYDIAFLKGDQAGMEREAARARERYGGENWISSKETFALAYSGRLRQARDVSRHAVAAAQQAGQRHRAGLWEAAAALREAMFGNSIEAKRRATAALALSNGRDVEYGAAFALALAGDSFRSETLAHDLETRFPEDTSVQFSFLPVLRARLALNRADVSEAMELLQTAVPHELGTPRSAPFGALYPIFVRGEAYLAAHQGSAAAAEFQKLLDHHGIVVSDPVGALAYLQLGRAYALSGNVTRSKSAYQNFLTLWKDADRDIPVLRQAEAEYTKLQ